MATVTKRDLVGELTNHSGLSNQQASRFLDALVAVLTAKLENGENVTLRSFGVFVVHVAKPKKGRNPRSPEIEIAIPERCVLRFRPSPELKAKVRAVAPEKVRGRSRARSRGNSD